MSGTRLNAGAGDLLDQLIVSRVISICLRSSSGRSFQRAASALLRNR